MREIDPLRNDGEVISGNHVVINKKKNRENLKTKINVFSLINSSFL